MTVTKSVYINHSADNWVYKPSPSELESQKNIRKFHESFPGYEITPLVPLPEIAKLLGVKHVFLKNEANRMGLPSFKLLGASWGVFRTLTDAFNLPLSTSLEDLIKTVHRIGGPNVTLVATTDGNHGRAVARMARVFQIKCEIFVPKYVPIPARNNILGEMKGRPAGSIKVHEIDGTYDDSLRVACAVAKAYKKNEGFLIQDTTGPGSDAKIPQWIVDGYKTMFEEVDDQLKEALGDKDAIADLVISPCGAGTFPQSVTSYYKQKQYPLNGRKTSVMIVEPETSYSVNQSLHAGKSITVPGEPHTIMDGLNCPTISNIAWPVLRNGVRCSVLISDWESHQAVLELSKYGVYAGPCGAATLAGIDKYYHELREAGILDSNKTVVLLNTEGQREYEIPERC